MSGVPQRAPVSEAAFQKAVIEFAQWMKWRVVHIRAARNGRNTWSVPYEGDPGLPDLILARNGRVLLVELKRVGENPTPDQAAWLTAAGPNGRLWRPGDWPQIRETLA